MSIFSYLLSMMVTLLYRSKNKISIGKKSIVYYKAKINVFSKCGKVIIGNNVRIGYSSRRYHAGIPFSAKILLDGKGSVVSIGDNTRFVGYCHASKSVKIGENCLIASGVNILDSNAHQTLSLNRTTGRDRPEEIVIGNNVWVGINSIILKGSTIGDNSIVAAGSVVKGTFPMNSIIQGNPAKVIKTLDL